ncbi:MAG: EF-P 5-aminopentanol modification-associated protein YfmF [Thermoanaerobacteraceae bacterium]
MSFISEKIAEDVYLHIAPTDKFKTVTINIYVNNVLGENATEYALIPSVLKRGTNKINTYKDMSKYLESLYGSTLSASVYKKGERHIQQYRMEMIQEDFIHEKIFEKGVEFLRDLIFNPFVENKAFKKEYVDQEIEIQKNNINGRKNDKTKYAIERCLEEMCKGEPFSIYELGDIESLNNIDEKSLFNYYKKHIEIFPVDIFVVGDVDIKYIISIFKRYFNLERNEVLEIPKTNIFKEVKQIKYVKDYMDVTQGKITLGFRTNVEPDSEEYYSLLIYSGILGGGPFSKLFMNVREKESLAYYAFSRLERFKGLMIIGAGIEPENYDKAIEIINLQLKDLEKGNISDYEFDSTIKSLKTSINAIKDSATAISDYYFSQKIVKTDVDIDQFIKNIEKVTKKDVVDISRKIKLDTVYFMANQKEVK